jgi:soluble lytic murein transglycosylase-like protein
MRRLPLITLSALALTPAAAGAAVPHTVQPGETLWSIAMQSNLTTRSLAAFNGLSPDAQVVLGRTIQVPTVTEAAGALQRAGVAPATTAPVASTSSQAPPALGAYSVRLGDTLSGIAARAGVPAAQIAAMNGLSLSGPLLAGTVIKLPTGAPAPAASTASAPAAKPVVPNAPPYAVPARLDAGTIGSIASSEGVPSSLATAIAWQESGFNNGMVSGANARGVMQVMPGTWQWVQSNLARSPLNPNSATDNVRAGSLYLAQLLRSTGGNVPQAVAGYYQGLDSVRRIGMYKDTQQYVANILALQHRFGG